MDGFRKTLRAWPWLAAIASGLLYTACFPPFNQGWLCWFALTPLLAAIWFSGENSKRRWLSDLALGYVAGLTFFWSVLSWLTTVTIPGWFLLQFYMAIYFAIWSWFCGLFRSRIRTQKNPSEHPGRRPSLTNHPWWCVRPGSALRTISSLAFVVAAAWVATEWFRGWVFRLGLQWSRCRAARYWPIIQIAEFTGVAGISFVVAFANVIAVCRSVGLSGDQRRQMRPHYDLTLTMAIVVGLFAYGFEAAQTHQPATKLRVALVQANVPREKNSRPNMRSRFSVNFRVSATRRCIKSAARINRMAGELDARPDCAGRREL